MTYFEDLSQYAYSDTTAAGVGLVRNVGWLGPGHDFQRGQPSERLIDAIWEYCSILTVPMRGLHDCEFCVVPSHTFVRHATSLLLGSGEIRVFNSTGDVFAAPNLIYHYIVDHQYCPPRVFLDAVDSGPRPRSEEYLQRLNGLDLRWRENVPISEEPMPFRFMQTKDGVRREEVKRRK